jgi:hypothetical protein
MSSSSVLSTQPLRSLFSVSVWYILGILWRHKPKPKLQLNQSRPLHMKQFLKTKRFSLLKQDLSMSAESDKSMNVAHETGPGLSQSKICDEGWHVKRSSKPIYIPNKHVSYKGAIFATHRYAQFVYKEHLLVLLSSHLYKFTHSLSHSHRCIHLSATVILLLHLIILLKQLSSSQYAYEI